MTLFRKWIPLLLCFVLHQGLQAQSALEKAESYAKLDAPFLSIKYLQKHLQKKKDDRNAMRLLGSTYCKVNMPKEGHKWLRKAKNIPSPFDYFQKLSSKINKEVDLPEEVNNTQKNCFQNLFQEREVKTIVMLEKKSRQLLLATVEAVTLIL